MKLLHKGVEYYAVPDSSVSMCKGCAFKNRFDYKRDCPRTTEAGLLCTHPSYMHGLPDDRISSIFITEQDYMMRRLKGTA